jgi:pyruvate/2-oxoacid:ferredoxin oxidoreductase beta subunit
MSVVSEVRQLPHLGVELPEQEYIAGAHPACAGCGGPVALKFLLKTLGPKTVVTIPPQCSGSALRSSFVSAVFSVFAASAAVAAGVKHGLEATGDTETQVVSYAGDGGTYDIGIQAISGAAERNDGIIHFCSDNEAYMNTGIQRSGATPAGAWTNSSPSKRERKKDIMTIMAAHHIPYAATVSIAYPEDFVRKVQRAKETRGFRFLRVLAPCPVGWRAEPSLAVTMARLAVQSKVDQLYEMVDGEHVSAQQPARFVSVRHYLDTQKRFAHLTGDEVDAIQARTDEAWKKLLARAEEVTTLPY